MHRGNVLPALTDASLFPRTLPLSSRHPLPSSFVSDDLQEVSKAVGDGFRFRKFAFWSGLALTLANAVLMARSPENRASLGDWFAVLLFSGLVGLPYFLIAVLRPISKVAGTALLVITVALTLAAVWTVYFHPRGSASALALIFYPAYAAILTVVVALVCWGINVYRK